MLNTIYIPKTEKRNKNILSGNTVSNNDYVGIERYSSNYNSSGNIVNGGDWLPLVKAGELPRYDTPPTDPDGDGLYEDLNGNAKKDFDVVVLAINGKRHEG
jgi:parallel beta-helix repeat protein